MPIDKEKILNRIIAAAPTFIHCELTSRILLFGSLVRNRGNYFHRGSDIDLLIEFAPAAANDAALRMGACERLVAAARELTIAIADLVVPADLDDPLLSIGAVTPFELANGINTRGEMTFGCNNTFLDVGSANPGEEITGYPTPPEFITTWQDATDALQKTQAYRKKFLSVTSRGLQVAQEHRGPEVIPKDIARTAAILQWFLQPSHPDEKYDFVVGGKYLIRLIETLISKGEPYASLSRLLAERGANALLAEEKPLSPSHQLLLWEILASEAIKQLERLVQITSHIEMCPPSQRMAPVHRMQQHMTITAKPSPYRVGDVTAAVYLGLLGGGDRVFTSSTLSFQYVHQWVPLAAPIEAQRGRVLDRILSDARKKPHNGPAVRLQSIDLNMIQSANGPEESRPILELRPTCWFDYIISNQQIDEPLTVDGRVSTIRREYADFGRLELERNIDWVPLSNIFTTSTVLVTSDRHFVFGRRTYLTDNFSGTFAIIAENMHRWSDEPFGHNQFWAPVRAHEEIEAQAINVGHDYKPSSCPNPFYTVLRGIHEEVAPELVTALRIGDIVVLDIAWDFAGFNPHLYVTVRLPLRSNEVQRLIDAYRATHPFEQKLYLRSLEPSQALAKFLIEEHWAEISKGAVLRTMVHEFGYQETDHKLRI